MKNLQSLKYYAKAMPRGHPGVMVGIIPILGNIL